jgi:hypothetical protein
MAVLSPAAMPRVETAGGAEDRVAAALRGQLDEGWGVFRDCVVSAGGETGRFDFVLLHAERGIALLAVVEPGEEIDGEAAVEAMRTMLREGGFPELFATLPAIAALAVAPGDCEHLGPRLSRALDGAAPHPNDSDWPDWVAGRMAVGAAPSPQEAPPSRPAASLAPAAPPRPSDPPRPAGPRLRRDLALSGSVALLAAALGMAAVAGGLWPGPGGRGAAPTATVALPAASAAPSLPVAAHRDEVAAALGGAPALPPSLGGDEAAAQDHRSAAQHPAGHPARHRRPSAGRPIWDRLTAVFR